MRCESGGEALVIQGSELQDVMDDFPHFVPRWKAGARRREELRQRLLKKWLGAQNNVYYKVKTTSPTKPYIALAVLTIQRFWKIPRHKGFSWNSVIVRPRASAVNRESAGNRETQSL